MQTLYYYFIQNFYFKTNILKIILTFFLYFILCLNFKNGLLDYSLCEENEIKTKKLKHFFTQEFNPFKNNCHDEDLKQDYIIIFIMILTVSKILIKYSGG